MGNVGSNGSRNICVIQREVLNNRIDNALSL